MRSLMAWWTMLLLLVGSALIYCMAQPVPKDWLLEHAEHVRIIGDYARGEPLLARWRRDVPSLSALSNFWTMTAARPYLHMPDSALDNLAVLAAPESVDAAVRRVVTVLLSPCSRTWKNRVVADPLRLLDRLQTVITPAFTSTAPALFVCSFGETKDAALVAAEAAERCLEDLAGQHAIGPFQGVCTFLVSVERQTALHRAYITRLDNMRVISSLDGSANAHGLDPRILRGCTERVQQLMETPFEPASITMQENQLALNGLRGVATFFFLRTTRGYLGVHRVLPAPGRSLEATRRTLERALDNNFVDAAVVADQTLHQWYYTLLQLLLTLTGIIWAGGLILILAHGTVRGVCLRLLGAGDRRERSVIWLVKDSYRDLLHACGLRSAMTLLRLTPTAPDAGAPCRVSALRRFLGEDTMDLACAHLCLVPPDSTPSAALSSLPSEFVLIRGYGADARRVRQLWEQLQRCQTARINVAAPAAFGEGWHNYRRFAAMLVPLPIDMVPIADLMGRARGNPLRRNAAIRTAFVANITMIANNLRGLGYHDIPWHPDAVLVDNAARVCLLLRRPLRRCGFGANLAYRLGRFRAVRTDLLRLLRCLWPSSFSYFNYARLVRLYGIRSSNTHCRRRLRWLQRVLVRDGWLCDVSLPNGMIANGTEWSPDLAATLGSFSSIMQQPGIQEVTRKRGRTVVTVPWHDGRGFLKRHTPLSLMAACRRWLEGEARVSSARAEWNAIRLLRTLGIPSIVPIAMGERLRWGFWERGSFLLTAELTGARSLEDVFSTQSMLSFHARVRLARRIGLLARRLHSAGLVHRDFYLGHIYLQGSLEGAYQLHLLDLQRVCVGAQLGNRWSVKDVSALLFSSLPIVSISNGDRLRFLLAYFNVSSLTPRLRRFSRRVLDKNDRVARHTEKLLARRRARGELPPLPSQPSSSS